MLAHVTYEAVLARGECSVARAMEVVGERWTFLVLREAFSGVRRFEDMQRHLGIARNVLADRLARLVGNGVLERRPYQEKPLRHEYRLTPMGLDLYPALVGLLQWGDRWLSQQAPLELVHRGCGEATQLQLSCAACGEAVTARDMRGRSAGSAASPPPARAR
jgi:DNA-binding HxlR family transcriptional regulator